MLDQRFACDKQERDFCGGIVVGAFSAFIRDFVSMLEAHGLIRNMKFWSIALSLLATLHFFMVGLIFVMFPFLSPGMYWEQACIALAFTCIGFTWMRVGKECARRAKK